MLVFKIALIGIAGAMLAMVTKQFKPEYSKILLKLLAIAYICQIASNLCEDLGYHSISFQIETIGKLSILVLSIPIISSLLETIEHLLT